MRHLYKGLSLLIVVALSFGCEKPENLNSEAEYYQVTFDCQRGEPITVRFYKQQELAVLLREEERIELTQQPTASGYHYTNMKVSIRGKGNELTLEIGRMAGISCQAR